MKHHTLITPPTQEPVGIADMVSFLRAGGGAEETASIAAFVAVAREVVEDFTGRALMLAGWRMVTEGRSGEITLDRSPLVEVLSVKYYADGETALTTMAPEDYLVIAGTTPGRVQLLTAPLSLADRPDALQVEFTAGASDPGAVPATLRHAVRLQAADYYEKRAELGDMSKGVRNLLESQRVGGWVA